MKSIARHVERALRAWERGENHQAIREFRRAVKAQPRQAELWVILGDVEQEAERFDAAERSYRRALALMTSGAWRRRPKAGGIPGPTEATTRRSLGAVLAQSGRLVEAEAEFRRSLALRPDPVTHVCVGEVCELAGRVREARASFVRALRLDRRCVEALHRLGGVHMWTAPARAERIFRKAIRRKPAHALALSGLGLLLCMRGAFDEAEAVLRRAARTGDAGALPHVYRGHLLLHQGRLEEAAAAYADARRAAPFDPHPLFAQGDLHRQGGRDEEAREAYEAALALDPTCGDAALRLARLHEDEGRPEEALDLYRRGLELTPQHPWADEVRDAIRQLSGAEIPEAATGTTPRR